MAQDRLEKRYGRTSGDGGREGISAARNAARAVVRGSQAASNWSAADGEAMALLTAFVTGYGGSVLFGMTRDRGARVVKVYSDLATVTEYLRPSDDVKAVFDALAEDLRVAFEKAAT